MLLTSILLATGVLLLGLTAWLLKWRLTPDWPFLWRKWSSWLAGLNAAAWAYVTSHTGMLLGFLPYIAPRYQGFAAGAVFMAGVAIPILAVHIRQEKVREATINRVMTKAITPNA